MVSSFYKRKNEGVTYIGTVFAYHSVVHHVVWLVDRHASRDASALERLQRKNIDVVVSGVGSLLTNR